MPTLVYLIFLYLINLARGAVGGFFVYAYALLLALPMVSVIHVILSAITLRYNQEFASHHGYRGEFLPYRLKISNELPLFSPRIRVRFKVITPHKRQLAPGELSGKTDSPGDAGLENFTITLSPGQRYEYLRRVYCPLIGKYNIGLESLSITDMLNWFSIEPRVLSFTLYVYPRVYGIPALEGDSRSLGSSTARHKGIHLDHSFFTGLREYRPGESVTMFHWKRFSSQGIAMIREYTPVSQRRYTIYLDTRRSEDNSWKIVRREDYSLELLVSCCAALLDEGVPVSVRIPGLPPISLNNREEITLLQQQCLEAVFSPDLDMLKLYNRDTAEGRTRGMSILFITHEAGGELLNLFRGSSAIQSGMEAVINETGADQELRKYHRRRIRQLAAAAERIHFTDADMESGERIQWL